MTFVFVLVCPFICIECEIQNVCVCTHVCAYGVFPRTLI